VVFTFEPHAIDDDVEEEAAMIAVAEETQTCSRTRA
jgi:hypothetical protein